MAKKKNKLEDIRGIWSDDIQKQFDATTELMDMLWYKKWNDKIDKLIRGGRIVPRMILFLQSHCPKLQAEAARVLAYIASGEHTIMVVQQAGIYLFVKLLSSANEDAKDQAILALGSISLKYRNHVLAGGALSPLLAQVRNTSGVMQHHAVKTLSELCRGPHSEFDVITPTLPILLQLINSRDEWIVYHACRALYHFLEGDTDHGKQYMSQTMINAGICPQLVQLVRSHPSDMVFVAALRIMAEIDNSQTQDIIDSRIITRLIHYFGYFNLDVQFERSDTDIQIESEAASVLRNIASGVRSKMVIDQGAIPRFVKLLSSANQDAKNQAILALGSISSTCSDYRDRVLAAGALSQLFALFENISDLTMQQNLTNTLSELCRGTHTAEFDVMGTLRILVKLLHSKDEATLYYACRGMYYLLEDDNINGKKEKIQALIDAGICNRLMQLVLHTSNRVSIAALNTVGYIAKFDDRQTQAIIDSRIITRLVHCLKHSDTDTKMKIEAAQAISRTVTRESNHLLTRHLIDEGFIQIFCEMLHSDEGEILLCCLKVLRHIIEKGEQVLVFKEDGTNPFVKIWINPYAKKIQECGGFDRIQYLSGGHGLPYSNDVFVEATLIKLNYIPDYY